MGYQQALMNEIADLPQEAFPNLLQIVRLFKESVLVQSWQAALALHDEFDQWERLSEQDKEIPFGRALLEQIPVEV